MAIPGGSKENREGKHFSGSWENEQRKGKIIYGKWRDEAEVMNFLDNSGCFYSCLSQGFTMEKIRVNIFWGSLRPMVAKLVSSTFDKKRSDK